MVRWEVWQRLRNMRDDISVMKEYQGLNLPPCHKRLENHTKYIKQVFWDIFNRKWSSINPELGGSKQGLLCSCPSLHLGGDLHTIAQKGGIQIEPRRFADLRIWSLEFREAKIATVCGQRKNSRKSVYRCPENTNLCVHRVKFMRPCTRPCTRPCKEHFWKKNNCSGAKAKQLPELQRVRIFQTPNSKNGDIFSNSVCIQQRFQEHHIRVLKFN